MYYEKDCTHVPLVLILFRSIASRILIYRAVARSGSWFKLEIALECFVYILHSFTILRTFYFFPYFLNILLNFLICSDIQIWIESSSRVILHWDTGYPLYESNDVSILSRIDIGAGRRGGPTSSCSTSVYSDLNKLAFGRMSMLVKKEEWNRKNCSEPESHRRKRMQCRRYRLSCHRY